MVAATAAMLLFISFAGEAHAGDGSGMLWGSDGNGPAPATSGLSACNTPAGTSWLMPNVKDGTASPSCGRYGAYIGRVGGFQHYRGSTCGGGPIWNSNASTRANSNYASGPGFIGTELYYFVGGPGADPDYIQGSLTEGGVNRWKQCRW